MGRLLRILGNILGILFVLVGLTTLAHGDPGVGQHIFDIALGAGLILICRPWSLKRAF